MVNLSPNDHLTDGGPPVMPELLSGSPGPPFGEAACSVSRFHKHLKASSKSGQTSADTKMYATSQYG